jgi:pimeloyl-ACP methyl ester carboxylesterase
MSRASTVLIAFVVIAVAAIGGFYVMRNPERRALDAAARQGAPGSFVALSDGVTHYRIDGPDSGRVVVLAHGFSVPLYIWDSTAIALARAGFRVVRYDAYGRGLSDRPDVPYTDALYDRQIRELLDSLKLSRVDLAGVSAGGFVTGVFAGRHPERVRSLVLVDPVAGHSALTIHPFDLPVIGPYLWQTLAVPGMAAGQPSDFVDPSKFPDWIDRYKPQMRYKGFGWALLSSRIERRGMSMDTVYKRVAAAGIPVMLLWGKEDHTVPFGQSAGVRAAMPEAEFHPIDGVGHLPILEKAALTDSLFLQFYARHS